MTVADLIKKLAEFDPDLPVYYDGDGDRVEFVGSAEINDDWAEDGTGKLVPFVGVLLRPKE